MTTSVAQESDTSVDEAALSFGSNPTSTAETATGTLTASGGTGPYTYADVTVGGTHYGTLTVNSNGTYSYLLTTKSSGDAVTDTFTFKATDASGNTATNTLVISIVDDVPTAHADTISVAEGHSIDSNVLTNDVFGADGAATTSPTGGVVGVRLAGLDTTTAVTTGLNTDIVGTYGTLKLLADGSYHYVAKPDQLPPAGAHDTFVYTIKDGDTDLSTTTLTINVNAVTTGSVTTTNWVDESALGTGTNPGSSAEAATGTIVLPTGWTVVAQDVTTGLRHYVINTDGTYTYTLLTAASDVTAPGASVLDPISYQMVDAYGNHVTNNLNVTIWDDGPVVTDTNGTLNNVAGQVLADVIHYNLGADGLGSVNLSYTGPGLTTHNGKAVVFTLEDSNSDGLKELVGRADLDGNGINETVVLKLAPTVDNASDGHYSLNLLDVLDQTAPTTTFSFTGITASGPVDSLTIPGTPLTIYAVHPVADNVNASSGYVGINNNVMNAGESIGYDFGTTKVNDVHLSLKDVGSGTDSFTWRAWTGSAWVDGSGGSTVLVPDGSTSTSVLSLAGGFTKFEITMAGGDFKVGGVSYVDIGAPNPLTLAFGYTATDHDGDAVSGSFSVVANVNTTTALLALTAETISHIDHKIGDPYV